jgi:hypothetical protein
MAIQESTPGGGKFSTSSLIAVGNGALACSNLCIPSKDCSTVVGNSFWDNAHTSNPSSRGERLGGESSTLVQHAQRTCGSSNG